MDYTGRVLIIGAGLGGLALAQALVRRGIPAEVFERAAGPDDALAGYGLHLNPQGWGALRRCLSEAAMARLDAAAGYAASGITFRDERLGLIAEMDPAALASEAARPDLRRRGIGRLALRELLLEDAPRVHWRRCFTHYREEANGVVAMFEDGSEERGAVLVGADASNSRVRRQRLPGLDRDDLGILAIAGRYPLDPVRTVQLPPCLRDGSLNNILPVAGQWMFASAWLLGAARSTRPGESEDALVWAYVLDRRDAPATVESMSPTELCGCVLSRIAAWSPALHTLVRDGDVAATALIRLRSMPHLPYWKAGRVTLIGDAIHNMTPMAGMGANTALRDAAELADRLASARHPVTAVAGYERVMRAYANRAVALSRGNAVRAARSTALSRRALRGTLRAVERMPSLKRALFRGAIRRSLDAH